MNEPFLSIYVKDNNLYFAKKLPTENISRVIVDVTVDEIVSESFDDASKKLGGTALGILTLWHKNLFESWGISKVEECPEFSDYDIAQRLIGKSVSSRSAIHVPTIELLLFQEASAIELLLFQEASANDDAKNFYENSWPVIRERLESLT